MSDNEWMWFGQLPVSSMIADLVWPALLVEQRLLGVIPIMAGLIAEWIALYFGGFELTWKRALVVDIVMNLVSSVIGIFLLPAMGFMWELFPGIILQKALHYGTFNPVTWSGTFLIAILATSAVEGAVMNWGFKILFSRRRIIILCLANTVSVGFAYASLWIHPPRF